MSGQGNTTILAFPPNRDTLGATAYFIVEKDVNILIDSPAWTPINQQFLKDYGGVHYFVLTHRGAIANVKAIQTALHCPVLVQEQEAYLLPDVDVTTFQHSVILPGNIELFWTPGHSPGSCCCYHPAYGGVLFTGRHLLPNPNGILMPIKTSKTFHWRRQLKSVKWVYDRYSDATLNHICPGANTGFLRGRHTVTPAYSALQTFMDSLESGDRYP
ncbi:MAG: MBL fold metallo-hydrolase [Cyanobacteriota bacterium SKYGB_h_bin112]|nr:MBL fold metallo-hydrolase [Cyanobacteriota bacterium SKYGB_h_bin112]